MTVPDLPLDGAKLRTRVGWVQGMTPAIFLPTVLALDRSSKNAVGVIADTVVGHITTLAPRLFPSVPTVLVQKCAYEQREGVTQEQLVGKASPTIALDQRLRARRTLAAGRSSVGRRLAGRSATGTRCNRHRRRRSRRTRRAMPGGCGRAVGPGDTSAASDP